MATEQGTSQGKELMRLYRVANSFARIRRKWSRCHSNHLQKGCPAGDLPTMGNKHCASGQPTGPDSPYSAREVIREAQRKYFNSHIETELQDSSEEDPDDSLDDDAFEDTTLDSMDSTGSRNLLMSSMTPTASVQNSSAPCLSKTESQVKLSPVNLQVTSVDESKDDTIRRKAKARFIRLSKRGKFFSIFNLEDKKARSVDPKMYLYPFENLIFEGGGNKGLAYCGAVRLLEEIKIWPQIRRLAGTSAGAMTAALLAIGYNSHDLEKFFSLNLNKIFLDHKFGYLSLLPNLLTSYGWNPGQRIYKWFGQKVAEKTGDPDTTFKQVYDRYKRELCVIVTNLNQMTTLYCHPKTTPDLSVRMAVRMSMSIPGLFKAVEHTLYGQKDIFVDGGVLCNYPIHCFDGWWLSMKPEDNFLEKLQPLEDIPRLLERSERFGTYNEKTLGMQLYSDNEQDLLKYQLENLRHGVELQELPNTKLAREKIKKKKLQLKTNREHRRLVKAMNAFLQALNKHNEDKNDIIDRGELLAALNDDELFPMKKRLILFGDVENDVILDYLDNNHNGQINYQELLGFMEETGISMQNRFLGYQRREIENFPGFLDTLQTTLLTNVKRVYVEERDLKRTVGINTGHVGTSDFVLEPADVEFVLERGRRSMEAFLKYYVATNHLKRRPEFRRVDDDSNSRIKDSLNPNSSDPTFPVASSRTSLAVPGADGISESSQAGNISPLSGPSLAVFPDKCVVSRTTSKSSSKSVSISDKIEVMEGSSRHTSVNSLCREETLPDVQEESDCIFIVEDESYPTVT